MLPVELVEKARSLKINVSITPWMFSYQRLGWGYQPCNEEQWEFFHKYNDYYSDLGMLNWILKFNNLPPKDTGQLQETNLNLEVRQLSLF